MTTRLAQLGFALAVVAFAASTDRVAPAASPSHAQEVVVTNTPLETVAQGTTNVAGAVSLVAGTQVGVTGSVAIANGNDAPIPVRSVDANRPITTSSTMLIDGQQVTYELPVPACPSGTQFLVTEVTAAPDLFDNTDVVTIGHWVVSVAAGQQVGTIVYGANLVAAGAGASRISASVQGGLPISRDPSAQSLFATIGMLDNVSLTHGWAFDVHVSGFCGQPYNAPFLAHPR